MLGVPRFAVAAGAFETQGYAGRAPFPHWFVVLIFIGCILFFLGCLRSLVDPEFRDRFLRFSAWNAKVKPGTHFSVVSATTASLLAGSFATLIGMSVLHHTSERLESYLGPLAFILIFANLISLYVDERRSGIKR
jgi:hypothetical protein